MATATVATTAAVTAATTVAVHDDGEEQESDGAEAHECATGNVKMIQEICE